MSDGHNANQRIERLLRDGTWTEPLNGVDVANIARRARRRQVARASAAGFGILGLVSAGAVAATHIGDRDGTNRGIASSPDANSVPWTDAKPQPAAAQDLKPCDTGQLSVSVGRTGAWHNMATQLVDIVNNSGESCALPAQIIVDATGPDGRSVPVDTSQLPKEGLELAAGQNAALMLGADATCPDSAIAKNLKLSIGEQAAFELSGSWIPLDCGDPTAISLQAVPIEPETQGVPLGAAIRVPDTLTAGKTAEFTITLTNNSDEPVTFKDCPSYDVSLKRAPVLQSYELNCAEAGPIPARGSTEFQMRLDVPQGAEGDDTLSWALNGYQAVASVTVHVG